MRPAQELPLRDIHLPAPVAWWPPAPGWWVLTGCTIAAALGALAWIWWRRRTALSRRALRELAAIRAAYAAEPDPHRAAQALSILSRRLARALDPHGTAAALTGEAWLARLDAWTGTDAFTAGAGRALAVAPYRPGATLDAEALFAVFERWLGGLRPPRSARDV
ncbi:MAG: DUF4381 domain-containing protein [Gammaproteobacteria bacterium]|nr:DUF4381 domain-containing protein [Gammaproteobacteria bacterium]MBI5618078.1 DUF4381 domain-containing protein [Gammaproteobacteria bacterium]